MLLLLVLIVSLKCSYCGPEIFKFTFQPVSQTVNPGGFVTLSCVATGRSGITYSWYRLDKDFSTPPSDVDLISGEVKTNYVVQAADVDDSLEERLFQCKATAGSDIILSNVATVLFKLSDNIALDSSVTSYNTAKSIPNDLNDPGVYLYRLECNPNVVKFDDVIKNGEPYDVQWFKTGETVRVEDNHDNMWTNYHKNDFSSYKVVVSGSEPSVSAVKQYDLFIFNVRTSDAGTYSCKAVSRVNKQEVLLGSTVFNVGTENPANTGLAINPKEIITGYMVLAVDSAGKIRSLPKVGDEVLLMCGVACRTSSGSLDPQYQWKDSSGNVIANTREHVITVSSTGTVTFTCEILNSDCTSKLSSAEKRVLMTVGDADFDPTLQFTFSKYPPEYMWYDTSDNSKSHDPFEIGCEGSYESGISVQNSVLRMPNAVASPGEDVVYDFNSSFSSDKSGVYQCVMFNTPDKVVLYQQTTNVVIAVKASTTLLTASSATVKLAESVTLTCVVEGYPEPALPTLTKSGSSTQIAWSNACTGTNRKECRKEFISTSLTNSGEYVCAGSNTIDGVENKSKDKLNLTIEGDVAATLTQTPSGSERDKGSSVTLTCKAEGNPLPTNLVLKKGNTILKSYDVGTDTTETYYILFEHTIRSLSLDDSGTYNCEGRNTVNGVEKDNSATLDIVVISAVEVTLAASNTSPARDESVTVTCTATGGRKPHSVELKKDTTTIKSHPVNSGFCTEPDLYTLKCTFVTTAGYASGGTYECIGKNTVANTQVVTVTKSINISVSHPVEVTMTPASSTEVSLGTGTTITCTVEGGKMPHRVTLTKADTTMITWLPDGSGSNELSCSGDHVRSCLYVITAIKYTDEGDYRCDGYNILPGQTAEQSDLAEVTLVPVKDVTVTLSATQVSSSNEVPYGDPFNIRCSADGGRIPFYMKFEHTPPNGEASDVVLYNKSSSIPSEVAVSEKENLLTYDYSVTSSSYNHDGTYNCLSKNRGASNEEKSDSKSQEITIVKNVEINSVEDIETDYGTSFTFTILLNGGRSPHLVKLENAGSQIFNWQEDSDVCSGKNEMTCTKVVGNSDVNFGYDGDYTVTAQNRAKDNSVKTDTKSFRVTVYKNVSAAINPVNEYERVSSKYLMKSFLKNAFSSLQRKSTKLLNLKNGSDSTLTYHVDTIITCNVVGGLPPHKVNLILPNQVTKTWTKDGSGNSLTCTGTHDKTCTHTFTPEYNSDGDYKCVGYNKVRSDEEKQEESTVVQLTTVRSTEVSISNETVSVLTNGTVDVHCTIVGKPLVNMSAVSWRHNTLTDFDWSSNVTTVKGSEDDYTLVSTLTLVNPSTNYSGSFNCNVQAENSQVISKSVVVSINNREYLDAPVVSHNRGEATEQDVEMSVTCRVEGFPRPSATLTYQNLINGEESRTISGASRIISSTSTEFEFKLSTSCEYSQFKFICETQTTKLSDGGVLKESSSVEGPIVTGCKNATKMNTEALIAAGVAAVLFVVIIVCGIYILHLRRRHSHNNTTRNVVYVNTTPENLGEVKQSTEHKYDDVVLHVSPGEAAYINTAIQSPTLHVYNDVVLPTADDTPYDYARSEDVVRNNVGVPIYNNHELK